MSSALGRADAKAGAVVVGLCAHGLATARALSRHGVEVVALEADTTLPGCATRMASVVNAGPMKGEGLHQTLIAAARSHGWTHKPVLFLMNDRMVRDVASHWSLLEPYFTADAVDVRPEDAETFVGRFEDYAAPYAACL